MSGKIKIPYYKPYITQDEIKAVERVLKSGFFAQGPIVEEFENEYSKYCGGDYCIAVSSCTAGLYLVCKYMKLYLGWKEVNIPAYTFTATYQAALAAGLKVNIKDITYGYEIDNYDGNKPSIEIMFAGNNDRYNKQYCLYNNFTILDAAHCAPFEHHQTRVYSFYPTKILASNGGGIIVTKDKKLADWCRTVRQHGRMRAVGHSENPAEIGFNFMWNDLSAAVAFEQLKKIDYLKALREEIADYYIHNLDLDYYYGDHLFIIKSGKRERIENALKENRIGYSRPYIPLAPQDKAPNAWRLYDISLSLPFYVGLTKEEQNYIIKTIRNVL